MTATPESLFPRLNVRRYREIDSTNTEGKRLVKLGTQLPMLLTADHQTAGRGRLGRSFYSPMDTGLYFTLVFRPESGFSDAVSLTQAAAVSLLRAVKKLTGAEVSLKWVNDLYLGPKKIAGILTEAVTGVSGRPEAVLIGIGVNLSTADFPEEIAGVAGSLGSGVNKEELLKEILLELIPFTENPADRSWLGDYRKYSNVVGKPVSVIKNGVSRPAEALAILDDGALLVRFGDGTEEALFTGEISIRFR